MASSFNDESPTRASWYERHWRWFVLGTLFLATFLNYFDRQTLGTAIVPIAEEFGLSNTERGDLLAAFAYSYAICHLFIGFITDRVRTIRWFFPIMLLGWSVSTMLVGFATSPGQIYWLRVLLGVWESVNFPICLLIIRRIFPAEERSLAAGIFASGAFLATLAAPPVVIYFSNHLDWRYSFLVPGVLGVLWVFPWLIIFRRPEQRSVQWSEAVLVNRGSGIESALSTIPDSLRSVLSAPGFWGVALIGLGIIPSLYFATQWLPTYLTQSLGQNYDQWLSAKLSMIYLMQDVGLWGGGALVLWFSRQGMSILGARKLVIAFAYLLMVLIVVVPFVGSVNACVALLCLHVCGVGAFLGNQHALKQDVDPRQVATIAALVGAIEMGFTSYVIKRVGVVTEGTADFTPVFFALAGLATFAVVMAFVFLRPRWFRIE